MGCRGRKSWDDGRALGSFEGASRIAIARTETDLLKVRGRASVGWPDGDDPGSGKRSGCSPAGTALGRPRPRIPIPDGEGSLDGVHFRAGRLSPRLSDRSFWKAEAGNVDSDVLGHEDGNMICSAGLGRIASLCLLPGHSTTEAEPGCQMDEAHKVVCAQL